MTLFLADRAYDAQGNLIPRKLPNSVIKDPQVLRARVRQFMDSGTVTTLCGQRIAIRARSILVHSDTPGSLELARTIRDEVQQCGATVASARAVLA